MVDKAFSPAGKSPPNEYDLSLKTPYTPNFIEYLWARSVPIIKGYLKTTSGNFNMYVVPEGKVFLLTNTMLSCTGKNNGSWGRQQIYIDMVGQKLNVVDYYVNTIAGVIANKTETTNYYPPIILKEGQIIIGSPWCVNSAEIYSSISGFEVDKALLNDLILYKI